MQELLKGDCIELMLNMEDACIDLIVTDPPYLMDYKTGRRNNKASKFDADQSIRDHKFTTVINGDDDPDLIANYIRECHRILKDDSAMYMFCNSNKIGYFVNEVEKYFTIRNVIVWEKNNHTAGDLKHAFGKRHEFIILANKGDSVIRGKRIDDIWTFPKVVGKGQLHQNQKPLKLIEQCIEKHSDVGDLVFDGFGGSGTTALAARNLKRDFVVVELDPEYYDVAVERLSSTEGDLLDF